MENFILCDTTHTTAAVTSGKRTTGGMYAQLQMALIVKCVTPKHLFHTKKKLMSMNKMLQATRSFIFIPKLQVHETLEFFGRTCVFQM
jgi:hypothetical protein